MTVKLQISGYRAENANRYETLAYNFEDLCASINPDVTSEVCLLIKEKEEGSDAGCTCHGKITKKVLMQ